MRKSEGVAKNIGYVLACIMVLAGFGIPFTAIVWLCLTVLGFPLTVPQCVAVEVLFALAVWLDKTICMLTEG